MPWFRHSGVSALRPGAQNHRFCSGRTREPVQQERCPPHRERAAKCSNTPGSVVHRSLDLQRRRPVGPFRPQIRAAPHTPDLSRGELGSRHPGVDATDGEHALESVETREIEVLFHVGDVDELIFFVHRTRAAYNADR